MRLLLVEDDQDLASLLARGLRERAFAVDVATDGEQAVYLAAVNPYDGIILDVALPKRDGFAVCAELRRRRMVVPILMLTARDGVGDRVRGLDLGADDYLTKPFELDELLARIRALLRRGPALAPTVIAVGDLEVDTRAQVARRAGALLPLTTKEFALLAFLARNANRVVGRAEISDHVWDDNYDPFSNLIESYINRLRRKVDVAGAPPLIQTRRGAGYMLSATASGEGEPRVG